RRIAAELIGDDYPRLAGTFRFADAPLRWAVDWDAGELAVVDNANRVQRLSTHGGVSPRTTRTRLTSLQHVPVQREIGVDDRGPAGAFVLRARVLHERPSDLLLALTAPDGSEARIALGELPAPEGRYELAADAGGPLGVLADVRRTGVWRLTLVDRRSGAAGTLIDWSLSFAGSAQVWRDAPERGLAIPDPVSTSQVAAALSADGRIAAVFPSREGVLGALAVWDLVDE